ncbi:class I SAM-dependent methyltransferase [Altericista sp. CCNU0014]|uniref:class I SAM-dependent methyltransferase n=1 Tax=Altericista sp. CCNU0014 TaxID=3082949 RepID=UPI00384E7C18
MLAGQCRIQAALAMLDDRNQTTYSTASIVRHYAQLNALQPAEKAILKLLQQQSTSIKMLDIGVGGGRTTQHFSKVASEYIGIDYSAGMISACKKRFALSSQNVEFAVCDARDMSQFEDDSFDFILFSFNGIDYVSHQDRLKIFQEINRIGKHGGSFFFSSHNLQSLENEFNIRKQLSLNPLKTYVNLAMYLLLRLVNRPTNLAQIEAADRAIIRDESHNFRLKTYYIRPKEQIHQLSDWFERCKVYSWKEEVEILNIQDLKTNSDMWLYYLCSIDKYRS